MVRPISPSDALRPASFPDTSLPGQIVCWGGGVDGQCVRGQCCNVAKDEAKIKHTLFPQPFECLGHITGVLWTHSAELVGRRGQPGLGLMGFASVLTSSRAFLQSLIGAPVLPRRVLIASTPADPNRRVLPPRVVRRAPRGRTHRRRRASRIIFNSNDGSRSAGGVCVGVCAWRCGCAWSEATEK